MAKMNRMDRAARARLLRLEQQEKNRVEDAALERRMAETTALGEARGEEFAREPQKRGEARKPIRRLSGLAWLLGKGRITDDQFAAGCRYASAYQKAAVEVRIQSILNRDQSGGEGRTMAALLADAEERVYAADRLAKYRRWLMHADLVTACDAICGEENTPREASRNGREAEVMEALLVVALDIILANLGPPRENAAVLEIAA